jgi:hypothetical protein
VHEHENERQLLHELREIKQALHCICDELKCICKALQPPVAHDFRLVQGENMGAITGIQAGSSDFFTAILVPANAAPLQSGPTFSTDDANVSLQPDPTNALKVTATVATGDTNPSFNLTVTGTTLNGTITHTFVIPILSAPPPQAVDFDLSQGA